MAKVGRPRKEVEAVCGNCRYFCTNRIEPDGFCPHQFKDRLPPDHPCDFTVVVPAFQPRPGRTRRSRKPRAGEIVAGAPENQGLVPE